MAGNGNGDNGHKSGAVPHVSLTELQKPAGTVEVLIGGEPRTLTVHHMGGTAKRDIALATEAALANPDASRVPLLDAYYDAAATCVEGATREELGTLPESVLGHIIAIANSGIERVAAMLAAEQEQKAPNPQTAAARTRRAKDSRRPTKSGT